MQLVLRPVNFRAVALRSAVHGTAMLIYFGSLAFLPVAQVAAGLFTAPIFVLLVSRFVYRRRIGPFRIVAVALGFAGAVLALGPGGEAPIGWASICPVAAGFLYALGNIATREWCGGESAATLTAGFFAALGVFGLIGMALLSLLPQPVPEGAEGFVLRGPVWPGAGFWLWTLVQAVGSLAGVGAMVRAYQLAEASRVAVFEYVVLPVAALWSLAIWAQVPGLMAVCGMVLIFVAGALIALRSGQVTEVAAPAKVA
jgi:drug/metabolite transporter (DMT)-like permease